MDTLDNETIPPPPDDDTGWRQAIKDGRLLRLPPEAVVAALQTLRLGPSDPVLNALIGHISDEMLRILRRFVGRNHPNKGLDIIERAHAALIAALLRPQSADGAGLRVAFNARVRFRAADAILVETRELERFKSYPLDDDAEPIEPTDPRPWSDVEEQLDVEAALARIRDPRKRLAFRSHMEGCPAESSHCTVSIADTLGVSDKTARDWVAEARELLKNLKGVLPP